MPIFDVLGIKTDLFFNSTCIYTFYTLLSHNVVLFLHFNSKVISGVDFTGQKDLSVKFINRFQVPFITQMLLY